MLAQLVTHVAHVRAALDVPLDLGVDVDDVDDLVVDALDHQQWAGRNVLAEADVVEDVEHLGERQDVGQRGIEVVVEVVERVLGHGDDRALVAHRVEAALALQGGVTPDHCGQAGVGVSQAGDHERW